MGGGGRRVRASMHQCMSGLVAESPKSAKVPHALLRMGQSWLKLGDAKQAGELFKRVRDRYPDNEASAEARRMLETMAEDRG